MAYLLIPQIKIHNANALSSAYTIGFPAMSAWLGAVHALERRLRAQELNIRLVKTAVSCQAFNLQAYKQNLSYMLQSFDLVNNSGEIKNASIIPEARCHLTISLLVETEGINGDNEEQLIALVNQEFFKMKLAGGDIEDFGPVQVLYAEDEKDARKVLRKLMPGYVLVERRDLMLEAVQSGQDALDALLDYLKIRTVAETDEAGKEIAEVRRKTAGWIVPIAVGFKAISAKGKVANQRDETAEHCFAESVVTLGQFKMPYRFESLDEIMWHYEVNEERGLYLCVNQ